MNNIKALRILTTNKCNYNCIYCHNEGQLEKCPQQMKSEDYIKFIKAIKGLNIKQVWFSGGEPFSNPETIKMILWTLNNTDYITGCATNASLLTEKSIELLQGSRIRFTINFPAVIKSDYERITGNHCYDMVINNLDLLDYYSITYSLNYVLHNETIDSFKSVLNFALTRNCNLKILPYTSQNGQDTIFNKFHEVENIMDKIADEKIIDESQMAIAWYKHFGEKCIRIRTYVNPCYGQRCDICRAKGELRVLPDFSFKTCLISNKCYSFNWDKNLLIEVNNLWKNFTSYYQTIIN